MNAWFRGNEWREQNQSNIEVDFLILCNRGYHLLHELNEMPLTPPYSHLLLEGIEIRPDSLFARHRIPIFFDGPVHRHLIIERRDKMINEILERHKYKPVIRYAYESYSPKSLRQFYEEVKRMVNGNGEEEKISNSSSSHKL